MSSHNPFHGHIQQHCRSAEDRSTSGHGGHAFGPTNQFSGNQYAGYGTYRGHPSASDQSRGGGHAFMTTNQFDGNQYAGYGTYMGHPSNSGQSRGGGHAFVTTNQFDGNQYAGYGTYRGHPSVSGQGRGHAFMTTNQFDGNQYAGYGTYRGHPSNSAQNRGGGHAFMTTNQFRGNQYAGYGTYRGHPSNSGQGRGHAFMTINQFDGNQYAGYGRGASRGRSHDRGRGNSFNQRSPHPFGSTTNEEGMSLATHQCQPQRGYRGSRGSSRGSGKSEPCNKRGNWRQRGGQEVPSPKQESKTPEQFLDFSFLVKPDVVRLMTEFKVMFILRGLPGSGKTTVAKAMLQKYHEHAVICCADNFRYNKQGEYVWSKEILQETHSKCQRQAEKFCGLNKPVVIIDNTNVTYPEVQTYIQIAQNTGYVVVLTEPKTPWKLKARELEKRNTHHVPFRTLSKRIEKFVDINPIYFAWFMSPKGCSQVRRSGMDILKSCLEIGQFKQCMAKLSDCQSVSKYTIEDIMYFYCMTENPENLHVTSCFSPRGRYLAGSPYSKCGPVLDSLGHISWITIIGWVVTPHTFSARVLLTKQQQKLWENDNKEQERGMPQFSRSIAAGHSKATADHTLSLLENLKIDDSDVKSHHPDTAKDSVEHEKVEMCLKPNYSRGATSHITLGKEKSTSSVESKHDLQTIINYELDNCPYNGYCLDDGTVRNYGDNTWVIYPHNAIKVPGIFSGYYV